MPRARPLPQNNESMLRTSLAPLLRRALAGSASSISSSRTIIGSVALAARAPASPQTQAQTRSAGGSAAPAPKIEAQTPAERAIADLIASKLDGAAERIAVRDTSGGCGSMYTIEVASAAFAGLSTVRQHQAVARALGDEVGKWHGFQLVTSAGGAAKP